MEESNISVDTIKYIKRLLDINTMEGAQKVCKTLLNELREVNGSDDLTTIKSEEEVILLHMKHHKSINDIEAHESIDMIKQFYELMHYEFINERDSRVICSLLESRMEHKYVNGSIDYLEELIKIMESKSLDIISKLLSNKEDALLNDIPVLKRVHFFYKLYLSLNALKELEYVGACKDYPLDESLIARIIKIVLYSKAQIRLGAYTDNPNLRKIHSSMESSLHRKKGWQEWDEEVESELKKPLNYAETTWEKRKEITFHNTMADEIIKKYSLSINRDTVIERLKPIAKKYRYSDFSIGEFEKQSHIARLCDAIWSEPLAWHRLGPNN